MPPGMSIAVGGRKGEEGEGGVNHSTILSGARHGGRNLNFESLHLGKRGEKKGEKAFLTMKPPVSFC